MKVRLGQVSNSSSSSFILYHKKGFKFNKENLIKELKIDTLPFKEIMVEVVNTIISCAEYGKKITNEAEYREAMYLEDDDEIENEEALEKLSSGDYIMYSGSFSSEEHGMEAALSEMTVSFATDNVILEGESY